MGKCSESCKNCKKCCISKKRATDKSQNNDEEAHGNNPLPLEIQIKEKRQDQAYFVSKTLVMKQCQFIIICGYFFFIVYLESTFQRAIFWWLGLPAGIYAFVFFFVRIKKNPPHFSYQIICLLFQSFSFSFIVGWVFVHFKYHVISLPLSVLFVYVSYFVMIPLFCTQKMFMDMSLRKYHLIPLWIIWIQNLILIAITAVLPSDKVDMVNKFDMMCIFCLPTLFWSTIFMWFSMLQLRQMLQGEWFYLVYDAYVHDYLYASLYLL